MDEKSLAYRWTQLKAKWRASMSEVDPATVASMERVMRSMFYDGAASSLVALLACETPEALQQTAIRLQREITAVAAERSPAPSRRTKE